MGTNENRFGWIDLVKLWAIYLMLVAHLGTWPSLDRWIHTFHMPIFFFVSGYCFNEIKNADLKDLIIKRFKTLIIPYCVFGTGLFILWNLALLFMRRSDEMRPFSELFRSMFWISADVQTFGVIQWFLPCMFWCCVFFQIILMLKKRMGGGTLLLLIATSILAYLVPIALTVRLPWSVDSALAATVFYGVGWKLRKLEFTELLERYRTASIFGSVVCIVVCSVFAFLNTKVNLRTISYGNYFLFYGTAIGFSISFCAIAYHLSKHFKLTTLEILGRHTLIILLLNSTFDRMWDMFVIRYLSMIERNVLFSLSFVVAIVIILCSTFVSMFIQRYLSFLVGKPFNKTARKEE